MFEIYAAALCQRKTGRTYQIGPGATHALTTMSSARNERVGHQHHDSHFRVHCGHSVDIANENWKTRSITARGGDRLRRQWNGMPCRPCRIYPRTQPGDRGEAFGEAALCETSVTQSSGGCRFSKCVSFSGGLTCVDAAHLVPCHLQSVSDACHFLNRPGMSPDSPGRFMRRARGRSVMTTMWRRMIQKIRPAQLRPPRRAR